MAIQQELRPTPWLQTHLKQVIDDSLKEKEIEESAGTLSIAAHRQLSLL